MIGFTNFHCHFISNCTYDTLLCMSSAVHAVLLCISTCHVCFRDNEGHTPLVKASLKGHHSVVNLLLKRYAKVEPQDLRAAIEEGNE